MDLMRATSTGPPEAIIALSSACWAKAAGQHALLAYGAQSFVGKYGRLRRLLVLHHETGDALDLPSEFNWNTLLTGAAGVCQRGDDASRDRRTIVLR